MLGENIAKLRKQRGYSLTELANLTNISKSYLSNIENNINKNPSLQIISKVATVLNVDLITIVNSGNPDDSNVYLEKEWVDFVRELKESGLEVDQISQFKTLIEFIKWKNVQTGGNHGQSNQSS
jgi:XRE family transcriptional regulator of biofilm formation